MRIAYLSCLISGLLMLGPATELVNAGQTGDKQATTIETIKSKIAQLGVGAKAKATVILKDGTKKKGYVARTSEQDFVIRDRKTDLASTISYADVISIDNNRGHSTAKHIGIGVGIGVGAFLATVLIILVRY
jgi:hypothetical protein